MDKKIHHSQIHLIARNSAALFIARGFDAIYGFLVLSLLTRYLQKDLFGYYNYIISIICVVSPLISFGLQRILIREITTNKKEFPLYFGAALVLRIIFSIIALIILLIIGYYKVTPDMWFVIAVLSFSEVIFELFFLTTTIFTAFEIMRYETYIIGIGKFIGLGLLVSVVILKLGIKGVAAVLLIQQSICFAIGLYITITRFGFPSFNLNKNIIKYLLIQGFPMFVMLLLTQGSLRVGIFIIKYYKDISEVGLFAAPYYIVTRLQVIPITLITAFFPMIARIAKDSFIDLERIYRKIYKFLFTLSLPIAIIGTILGKNIIVLLAGKNFEESYAALQVLIWIVNISFLEALNNFVILSVKKQWFTAINYFLLFAINLIIDILLVPKYGYIGACWGTSISYAIIFVNTFIFLYINKITINIIETFSKPLLCGIGMGVTLYYFRNSFIQFPLALSILLSLALSAIVYLALLLLTKSFSTEELTLLRNLRRTQNKKTS